MSSILRALKRIEKEAPPPDESYPWPRPIDSKKAINARVKKTWLYNKLFRILVIVIIVVALGWLVISRRHVIMANLMPAKSGYDTRQPSAPSKKKSSVYQAKISSPSKQATKTPQRISRAPAKPSDKSFSQKKSTPLRTAKPLPAVSSPDKVYQEKAGQPQPPPSVLPLKKSQPPKAKTKAGQFSPQSSSAGSPKTEPAPVRSTSAPARKRKTDEENRKFDSIGVFNDPVLKLQAIAWSQDAARRMVVINSRIIREGETVDGFSVIRIRENDVVINDGTNSWRLEFSLKQ